jgi:tRNA G18 (ribose-2'-O)-methylase SpoU
VVTRIEMAPGFDSLNVATASGIALHAVATRQAAAVDRTGGTAGDL